MNAALCGCETLQTLCYMDLCVCARRVNADTLQRQTWGRDSCYRTDQQETNTAVSQFGDSRKHVNLVNNNMFPWQ